MTRLERIEKEIARLSPEELERFRAWFAQFDAANWDRELEADAEGGALDRLAEEALGEHSKPR
jgi:hypothetical protein